MAKGQYLMLIIMMAGIFGSIKELVFQLKISSFEMDSITMVVVP